MLKGMDTLLVDELYLSLEPDGKVVRMGVNNGAYVDPSTVNPRALVPKSTVRIVNRVSNIPLILSAGDTYNAPVEVISMWGSNVHDLEDHLLVLASRSRHNALSPGHQMGYLQLSVGDMYSVGHTYKTLTSLLGVTSHTFDKRDLDFALNTDYIEDSVTKHVMSDAFALDHASDLCALVMDPRFMLSRTGEFDYSLLHRALGFSSFENACNLVRRDIEANGSDPLPYGSKGLIRLFKDVSGQPRHEGWAIQMMGTRILRSILCTPLDNLGVSIPKTHTGSKMARDAEVVRQTLHKLVNKWLFRIYGSKWTIDEYSADKFEFDYDSDYLED